jgi:ribosomal-protein-alanine N-acetyltransferase
VIITASLAHAELFAAMHTAAFPTDSWSEDAFASLLTQPGVSGLIDPRGGFLLMRAILDEAEILTLGVTLPRQGIGRALLSEALARATAGGVQTLHLEVAAGNHAARALYGGFGFRETGCRPAYYADGGDALTLSRPLP